MAKDKSKFIYMLIVDVITSGGNAQVKFHLSVDEYSKVKGQLDKSVDRLVFAPLKKQGETGKTDPVHVMLTNPSVFAVRTDKIERPAESRIIIPETVDMGNLAN